MDLMKKWLSPAQAARKLGVTTDRIKQMSRAGIVVAVMTPLGRLFAETDVDELARRRAKGEVRAWRKTLHKATWTNRAVNSETSSEKTSKE